MKPAITKLVFLFLLVITFEGCQKELQGDSGPDGKTFNLKISFKPVVDNIALQFNQTYKNAFQEPYTVTTFKFYICNISLINSDSNIVYKVGNNDHFLIDAADTSTTLLSIKASSYKYNYISFTIGVDSVNNVSGAQTGALDPAKGMFWTWNSGYIMAKLEGNSPLSTQPNNKFEYHIGGFKGDENVVENVLLPFPNYQEIQFLPNTNGTITLDANINAWFNNPNQLKIATTPVCTTPGLLARKFADNYSNMFSIAEIINNK